ncbi:hypothetical protein II906_07810 [bacterium]|nr:hypothetical protein [bacterium]
MAKKIYLSGKISGDPNFKENIDNSIKAEIQEVKSYKFRVALEDGSLTPWQYSDHNPTKNDLDDVKKYYTKLAEKKRLEQPADKTKVLLDYKKKIWNDYISAVRTFLPKEKLNDRKAVLEASKHALAKQADVTGAIGIINNEFSKRGVKSRATLVKAIKEAAYPEFSKKQENKKSNDDDFGHGR